jgi:SAM-dependent methyltransferase
MLDEERKRLERDIYNRQTNMERPQFASYWDADLYRRMHAFAYDRQVEDLGARFMTDRKVLVLGAGNSEAKFALRFSSDVHALNISERAVTELKKAVPEAHSFVGDAEKLDLSERYDVVLCKSILHHLHPIEDVLASIRRVLTTDGHLVIVAEPGLLNPFAAAARRFAPSQQHTPGEKAFVFSRLRKQLARDYVIEVEHYHFIASMLLPYAAKKVPALRPLANALLQPSLQLEALLRMAPGVDDLCWVMAGAYRAR